MSTASVIREYRTPYPVSVEEFEVGFRHAINESSKRETGGEEGVEIVVNEPFEGLVPSDKKGEVRKGQYTHKILHLRSKMPLILMQLAPNGSTEIHQKTWNCYPNVWTTYENPEYMKEKFMISVETKYQNDAGTENGVFDLSPEEQAKHSVDDVDFVNDPIGSADYNESEDPSKFSSTKTNRGPLDGSGWEDGHSPVMCCYSLYRITFLWWGLQSKVESIIAKSLRRHMMIFARLAWASIDTWHGMSVDELNQLEDKTKGELDEARSSGSVTGMRVK